MARVYYYWKGYSEQTVHSRAAQRREEPATAAETPIVVDELGSAISEMMQRGDMAFLLVGQHADVALAKAADAIIIERGRIAHRARSAALEDRSRHA